MHSIVRRHAILAFPNLHFRVGIHTTHQALVLSVLQVLRGGAVKDCELSCAALFAECTVRDEVGTGRGSGGTSSGARGSVRTTAGFASLKSKRFHKIRTTKLQTCYTRHHHYQRVQMSHIVQLYRSIGAQQTLTSRFSVVATSPASFSTLATTAAAAA